MKIHGLDLKLSFISNELTGHLNGTSLFSGKASPGYKHTAKTVEQQQHTQTSDTHTHTHTHNSHTNTTDTNTDTTNTHPLSRRDESRGDFLL